MAIHHQMEPDYHIKSRIHVEDPQAKEKIRQALWEKLQQYQLSPHQPVTLLCIGTDRSTGDCLGPLVGSKLREEAGRLFYIRGTLDDPLHAGNLQEYLDQMQLKGDDSFVIALDACLGKMDMVGCITIGHGSLQPGAGVNKSLPPVGHVHITGIVNVGGFMEYMVLQNTRLNLVMKMANAIADGIAWVDKKMQQEKARTV